MASALEWKDSTRGASTGERDRSRSRWAKERFAYRSGGGDRAVRLLAARRLVSRSHFCREGWRRRRDTAVDVMARRTTGRTVRCVVVGEVRGRCVARQAEYVDDDVHGARQLQRECERHDATDERRPPRAVRASLQLAAQGIGSQRESKLRELRLLLQCAFRTPQFFAESEAWPSA